MMKLAVLTSGGDAPGMNAAIQAVVKVAAARGFEVFGIIDGYDGLIDGLHRPLTRRGSSGMMLTDLELDRVSGLGGTFLGSARCPRFHEERYRAQALDFLHSIGVGALVVIGGNGSLAGAHALATQGDVAVGGIPASIDNDIGLTREALGVDTALNTIVEACDRISDTARSHHRAFIVEVMGRDSGYLAMASAVATAADAVLLPEHGRSFDEVVDSVSSCIRAAFSSERGKRRVLIIKAEGVDIPTHMLVDEVDAQLADLDVEIRGTVLGHVVRGGNSSFRDRLLAGRFGLVTIDALVAGRSDFMVGWNLTEQGEATSDGFIRIFPISEVLAETEALLDGSSEITMDRVRRMEAIQGVLAI